VETSNPLTKSGDTVQLAIRSDGLQIEGTALATKSKVYKTLAELRTVSYADTGAVYAVVNGKRIDYFYYDKSDITSPDDTALTIVAAGGIRLKKQIDRKYRPEDFGAIGDGIYDCTYAFQKMFNAAVKSRGGSIELTPDKNYKITSQVTVPDFYTGLFPAFVINGNGATITSTFAGTVFAKVVATQAIADSRVNSKLLYTNINFIGPSLAGSVAIKMYATYGSRIENCTFANYDTAILARFALNSVIAENAFHNGITTYVYLGAGDWSGASGANSQSNKSETSHNRYFSRTGMYATVMWYNSSGLVSNDDIYEGGNPVRNLDIYMLGTTNSLESNINRPHIENAPTSESVWYRVPGGIHTIDQPYYQLAHTLVRQGQTIANPTIILSRFPYMPSGTNVFSADSTYYTNVNWCFKDWGSFTGGTNLVTYFSNMFKNGTDNSRTPSLISGSKSNNIFTTIQADQMSTPGAFLARSVNIGGPFIQSIGTAYFDGVTAVRIGGSFMLQTTAQQDSGKIFSWTTGSGAGAYVVGRNNYWELRQTAAIGNTKPSFRSYPSGNNSIGHTSTPLVTLDLSGATDALALILGTTAQRPATPLSGYLRFNSDSASIGSGAEIHNGTSWKMIGTVQALRDSIATLRAVIAGLPAGGSASETTVNNGDADYSIAAGSGNVTLAYNGTLTTDRACNLPAAAISTNRIFFISNAGAGSKNIIFNTSVYQGTTAYTTLGPGGWVRIFSDGTTYIISAKN
jgi:hypothetical protein